MEKMKIEVWSDMVCPFCYLGKQKLQQAIRNLNLENRTAVIWHSFLLDPDFPPHTSMPSAQYLTRKGYPEATLRGMQQQLTERGRSYGIRFAFDRSVYFNTLDAHRLWQWSKESGHENEFKEAVFLAHFTEGRDLSEKEELLQVAALAGLDRIAALNILDSDAYAQAVEEDIYQSRQLGIRGVPYFLIDDEHVISGAQDDAVFERALAQALPVLVTGGK